jgi:hypothetical protein
MRGRPGILCMVIGPLEVKPDPLPLSRVHVAHLVQMAS